MSRVGYLTVAVEGQESPLNHKIGEGSLTAGKLVELATFDEKEYLDLKTAKAFLANPNGGRIPGVQLIIADE